MGCQTVTFLCLYVCVWVQTGLNFFLNLPLLDRLFVVVAIVVLLLLCVSSTTFQKALAGGRNKNDISLI